jgi:hypothetical protein
MSIEKFKTGLSEENLEKKPQDIEIVTYGIRKTEEEIKEAQQIREELKETREKIKRKEDTKREREEKLKEIEKKLEEGRLLSKEEAAMIRERDLMQTPNTPETQEVSKTPETPEAPEIQKDLLRQLDEARKNFIDAERKYKEVEKKKDKIGLTAAEVAKEKAELEYKEIRIEYARQLFLKKIEILKQQGIDKDNPQFKETMSLFKAELMKEVFESEGDKLAKARVEGIEPRKRTWFREMMANYTKMPFWKRTLITTGITTGALVAGGVFGGVAAAAIFGGQRFVRGMISGKVSGLTFGLIKTIGSKRIEKWRQEEITNLNKNFNLNLETINQEKEFRNIFEKQSQEYENIVKTTNKKYRNLTKWALGGAIVTGGATGYGLAMTNIDGPLADYLNPRITKGLERVGGGITSETPIVESVENIVEAQKGDSVWEILERQLGENYGEDFTSLNEGQRIYIIDALKDRVVENPESFGLKNIDTIKPGQEINLTSIFANKTEIENIFNRASALTETQIGQIIENNETLREWIKEHPGQRLDSERIGAILRGEIPPVEAPPTEVPVDIQALNLTEREFEILLDWQRDNPEGLLTGYKVEELLTENRNIEILKFSEGEYNTIKNVTVGEILRQIPENIELAYRHFDDEGLRKIKLPYYGEHYDIREFRKHFELARFIRRSELNEEIRRMTVQEFLKQTRF